MQRIFLFLLLLSQGLWAKNTAIYISVNEFLNAERENYLEIYFGIESQTLDYQANEEGAFKGGLEILLSINQDSTIFAADRFRILSPNYTDTSELSDFLYHQEAFVLKPGNYTLNMEIVDINDPEEKYTLEKNISLGLERFKADLSQVLFLEKFAPAQEGSKRYKRSGFEMQPIISSGTPYFPPSLKTLSFYLELYNLDQALGADEDYLLRYYLRDENTGQKLNNYASYSKKKAQAIDPVLASFNIEELPSGNYSLVVEAINKEGEATLSREYFFFRSNPGQQVLAGNFEEKNITGTFVARLGNLDSIYRFVEYLYPISTDLERTTQESLLQEAQEDQLKKYFLAFWEKRSPLQAQETWQEYYKEVRIANKLFSTGLRAGYKSDRGRVWLTYGQPDNIDKRDMEPNMPPYIIWQYNNIATPYTVPQNNRVFIFGEFEPSTREFQLIHSTAIGELQSRDWRRDLYYRAYGGGGSIDPDSDPNSREFGSRANQNIILGTTGADRINR